MKRSSKLASIPIDADPKPRRNAAPYRGIAWPVRRTIECPLIVPPSSDLPFQTVLESRRSERSIVNAPLREVINAIAFATRPRFLLDSDFFERSRRPTVSSGALHSVECVVLDWRGATKVMRYVPHQHRLELLVQRDLLSTRALVRSCKEIVPMAGSTAIIMIGDAARLAASYDNSVSLLWRDAGALLQTLSLVSAAYRMAFCPLGLLGWEIIAGLGIVDQAVPLGVGLLGRAASNRSTP